MIETVSNQKYTFTTENIRFPTFYNKEYEKEIMKPVTIESFIEEITTFQKMITQLENTYSDLISSNIHEVSNLITQNGRVPLSYHFLVKELLRMTMLILFKVKAQFNLDASSIDQYKNQTIDDMIASFSKDERISKYVNQYYPDKSKIKDLLSWIFEREQNVIKSKHRTGLVLLSNMIKYSKIIITEIDERISKFKSIKQYVLDNINIISTTFHNGYLVEENDICNQPEDSEQWKKIKKIMVRVVSTDEAAIMKEYKEINKLFPFFGALSANGLKSSSNFKNFFSASSLMMQYKRSPDVALRDYKRTIIDVNDHSFVTMLNLTRVGFIKKLSNRTYPKIKYRQKFYLKRYEKVINLDYIKEIIEHVEKNPNTPMKLPPTNCNKENGIYFEKVEKNLKKDFVSTRLLHCYDITTKKESTSCCYNCKSKTNITKDSLIIYIHGGGFIGGTTFNNEKFARVWVNHLQIPLIGIDYGISPEHPYPEAINDAWQAYIWILKNAKEQWQIDPKHIILTGDSAGASICFSLTYLLIIHNIRLPDLLILTYPACDTELESMTNSQLLVYKAPILHYKFLTYCNASYVGKYDNKNDYIINHARAPKEILKKLPKTTFLIGSGDVLRDGAIRAIAKIAECDIDCKVYDFKELGHGFFDWNFPAVINNPMAIFHKEVNDYLASTQKIPGILKEDDLEKNTDTYLTINKNTC